MPYGFFEKQMHTFFSQFGAITRLRLARNSKVDRARNLLLFDLFFGYLFVCARFSLSYCGSVFKQVCHMLCRREGRDILPSLNSTLSTYAFSYCSSFFSSLD